MFRAVDVLGFAGGFTLGMVQAGFELVGKKELPGGFGVANCEANRGLLGHNWVAQTSDPAQWGYISDVHTTFGNPPCSGFSGMSAKHFRGANSPINACMWNFVDYVAKVRPYVAVFESVQLAFTRSDGLQLMRALREHLEQRTGERWTLHHVLHNAYSVGGCSQRRRYFWVVSRLPFGIEWPTPTTLPVLDDAIGDLEDLPESWSFQPYGEVAPSHWASNRRHPAGRVDGHISTRGPLVQRCIDLLARTDWRPREHVALVAKRVFDQDGKLPDSWSATESKVVSNGFNMGFNTPVRWSGDEAARVITGGGLVTALHPRLSRMLTHREVARIMGFPDTWVIEPLKNLPGLQATWGKGITVDCGRWIGGWVKAALEETPGSYPGQLIGDREFLIDVTNAWKQSMVQSIPTLKKFKRLLQGDSMTEPLTEAPEVPVTEGEEATETPATAEAKTGKGRPRPAHTIEQDAKALEAIKASENGLTKEELATALGAEAGKAYLSLYRLRVDEEIYKRRVEGKVRWFAGKAPTETETPTAEVTEAPAEGEPVAI